MTWLLQASAAVYLASGLGALLGLLLPSARLLRGAVSGLALGAVLQALVFATLHERTPVPSLTDLPQVIAFMVWVSSIGLVLLNFRFRLGGLVAVMGPVAFLAVFLSGLNWGTSSNPISGGSLPHIHILLSSSGLGLLGISGLSGFFYLLEHRRLKRKRLVSRKFQWPSLEALDQVGLVCLATGFTLLTLGLLTGSVWVRESQGQFWTGSSHAMWTLVAWLIYAGLLGLRAVGHQGARQAAATAVGGFLFLLFAVLGVGAFL
ncbi:MAG: cytochrome c biogenesis protein CcsA [Myxococcota bacterium]|nr:cytochrome c biogenesis protein CcsA [Myxococcota bacterium]